MKQSLVEYALKHIPKTLQALLDLTTSLQISYEDMESVMGHLRHNKEMWGYLYPSHPQFSKTLKDIKELLPEIHITDPIIIYHYEANWLLVVSESVLLPVILLLNPNPRDGLSVGVYRIVQGKAARWLGNGLEYVMDIVKQTEVPVTPTLATVPTSPYVVLDLG